MSQRVDDLPLSYRAEVLESVMPRLAAGECCALVGTTGVGKSNLTHFLSRRDVQAHYWGQMPIWVTVIDAHGVLFENFPTGYAAGELLVHRLLVDAERRGLPKEFLDWATDLHRGLVAQPDSLLAARYLERICACLIEEYHYQLVLVFDQFDDLWQRVDARFFLNLRAVRDEFKYEIAYLVLTRHLLERLRSDNQAVESFAELFSGHVFGLGMHTAADARALLDRIARRSHLPLCSDVEADELLRLSGGHPALLRALFWASHPPLPSPAQDAVELSAAAPHYHARAAGKMPDQAQPMPHDNAESLLRIPSVREACAHIWQDLSPVERQVARFIAQELRVHSDDAPIVEELQLTQIVRAMSLNLFSPLFRDHVNEQAIEGLMGVAVDMRRRQVWVDGYLLSRGLGRQEFDLLELLARNAGAVCPTLQIMQALWPDERHVETNSADGRLDGIVNRLRTALGERGRRYIVRHPRVGIQLTAGCLQGQ